jgi:molecular chaperone DnaK
LTLTAFCISAKIKLPVKSSLLRLLIQAADSEIEKMKRDAKEHEGEDKKKKEQIDVKNQADSLVFQSKQLDERCKV